jgi:eukaryotic-like serine/threonine-protein kinase
MKTKFLLITSFALLAISLSACTAADVASSWPVLTVDVTNNTGYLAYNQYIYAIDLTTGIQKWKFPAKSSKGESFYSAPILTSDGQLIAGSYNHVLYSINLATGQANAWSFKTQHRIIANPLATEQAIYVAVADGKLYALDTNLKPIWKTPFTAKGAIWAQPAPDGVCNCIFVASMDHNLYAVDTQTGSVIWERDLGGALVGTPTISPDGKLYIGSFDSEMYTLDAKTGNIIGQPFKTNGWIWGGPALSDGHLYFGDLKGNFYVLNIQDGSASTSQLEGAIISTPLVISDTVYVTTEAGHLYTLDKTGKVIKPAYTLKGKLQAPAIQYNDLVLITPVGSESYLIALDATGKQVWAFPTPKAK